MPPPLPPPTHNRPLRHAELLLAAEINVTHSKNIFVTVTLK